MFSFKSRNVELGAGENLLASSYETLRGLELSDSFDFQSWIEISKLIGQNSFFVDRTSFLATPVPTAISDLCRWPDPVEGFSLNYEEICARRVDELLSLQEQTGNPLAVMYSGGIDSTLMLVSLFKRMSVAELRDRMTIYLNVNSINENPNFYRKHILGKLRIESSEKSLDLLNGKKILLGAEFNDHLFGNYLNQILSLIFGQTYFKIPYSVDFLREILRGLGFSDPSLEYWIPRLHHAVITQTVAQVSTMAEFFWWFNFNYRWQATYFSLVLRLPVRFRERVSEEFLKRHYHHFFMTDDFQRWALTNADKKIRETWTSYKWPAKDLIFEFDGNQDYRDRKIKAPSLNYILMQKVTAGALTSNYRFIV